MSTARTLDEVLFDLHQTVKNPTPAEITRWINKYPEFADDIRSYVVEMIDMEFLASGAGKQSEKASPSISNTKLIPTKHQTFRDAIGSRNMTLVEFSRKINISQSVVSDVNSGRIASETIIKKFYLAASDCLNISHSAIMEIIGKNKEVPRAVYLKSKSGFSEGSAMTWQDAVLSSDMTDAQKSFWLADGD